MILAADALYVSSTARPSATRLNAALRSPRDVCYLAHEPRRAWSQGPDGPVQDATDDVLDAFLDLCCDLDVSEVGRTGKVQLCASRDIRPRCHVIIIVLLSVQRPPAPRRVHGSTPILVHRPLAVRRAAVAGDLVVLDGELVVVHDLLSGL